MLFQAHVIVIAGVCEVLQTDAGDDGQQVLVRPSLSSFAIYVYSDDVHWNRNVQL